MALGAQVADRLVRHHSLVFRAMGPVTAQTVQRKILVSRICYLLPDGMGGVFHPVMAGSAEIYDRRLLSKEYIVG
jgi:hypothetical protein